MFKTTVPLYKNFFSNWLLILTEIHWNKLWRRFKIWLACVRKCLCPFKWDKKSSYSSVFSMIWNGLYERWPEYFVFMYLTVEWMKGRWIFFFSDSAFYELVSLPNLTNGIHNETRVVCWVLRVWTQEVGFLSITF